ARQEMPLVRQALDRHMRGEEAVYTLDDNYNDLILGGKIPAYYHQEVPCCANCFLIYSIIDKARAKAKALKEKTFSSSGKTKKKRKTEKEAAEEHVVTTEGFETKEDIQDFFQSGLTSHQKSALQSIGLGRKRKYAPS